MRPSRLVLYALPLVTVLVIAFAVVVVGGPRPYVGARVYGGPTEGASRLSLRLAMVERFLDIESPAKTGEVRVEARLPTGKQSSTVATPDEMGSASVTLDLGEPIRGAVLLTVEGRGGVLAQGRVMLQPTEWSARAQERGGFIPGQKRGELSVRAAPGRGVFAVPFSEPLLIDVTGPSGAEAGAKVTLDADGAEVKGEPRPTDAAGRTEVALAPRDHIVSITLRATSPSGRSGELTGFLPVAVGALRASMQEGQLRVESAVERDLAYYALVSQSERLAGGALVMTPDLRGGAVGLVSLPSPLPKGPLWAVVSSEPELDTASTVGWPLEPRWGPLDTEPPRARAVPDRLHLDGTIAGFAADAARRQKARSLALGFTLLAAVLAALLLVREGRRSARELDEHLRAAGAEDRAELAPSRWLGVAVAILCVAMGFAVVLLVAMYRMG